MFTVQNLRFLESPAPFSLELINDSVSKKQKNIKQFHWQSLLIHQPTTTVHMNTKEKKNDENNSENVLRINL